MAEVEYLHVCDSAFMAEGGKHCIIGIFDAIHSAAFPAVHPVMTVAFRVRGQASEIVSLRIELARPNGEVLGATPLEITIDQQGSAFVNMNMVGTQFPEPGRYAVKVSAAGRTLVSHPLHLHRMQAPPQAGPQGQPQKFH
jgi:hypothetical protein